MAQMTVPKEPSYRRRAYTNLRGADFSVDPSLVDLRHSPDLLNMISDNGGNPVKRNGWEVIAGNDDFIAEYGNSPTHPNREIKGVSNIWHFSIRTQSAVESYAYFNQNVVLYTISVLVDNNPKQFLRVMVQNEDGTWNNSPTPFKVDNSATAVTYHEIESSTIGRLVGTYSKMASEQEGFYIFATNKLVSLSRDNGEWKLNTSSKTFVPTTIISRHPTQGGGVVYDDINILTRERKEQFLNIANNKAFTVSATNIDTSKPYSAKYRKSDGTWGDATVESVVGSTFTLSAVYNPVMVGQDNIIIQYFATEASASVNATTILANRVSAHYSNTSQDQLFLARNTYNSANYVYYSAQNDITYWPDLNYMNIGGANSIMGFLNLGEYLAVVKENDTQDSTIFLIYETYISSKTVKIDDKTTQNTQIRTFATKRATSGIGAVSPACFAALNDEPLFFSTYGVHGVVSTNTTSEKIVRNRSYFLDAKLTKEPNLQNAVACVWQKYYILVVNNHAYLLDGRHKTQDSSGNTSYAYEGYYWDNIPAKCITSWEDELWFGRSDGVICRLKNEGTPNDYSDNTNHFDGNVVGKAIKAVWSTPYDNDGQTEYYKTMMKKGSMCTVAPFNRSSVDVYVGVDGFQRKYIGSAYVDISGLFDGEIDFSRLSFDSRTTPRDYFFKKKQKKYKRLQITLENTELNEPFGVFEIVKTFTFQRFAKK